MQRASQIPPSAPVKAVTKRAGRHLPVPLLPPNTWSRNLPLGRTCPSTPTGEAISKFARTAVAWATAEGFLQGFPGGSLQPRGTLTRAQMAKLLTILDQKF
ncbi:MAG: S-layer homology domain-containing protein [Oscillospiraceae bacterium]